VGEDEGADFGGEGGEERGVRLRVDVPPRGDLGVATGL